MVPKLCYQYDTSITTLHAHFFLGVGAGGIIPSDSASKAKSQVSPQAQRVSMRFPECIDVMMIDMA